MRVASSNAPLRSGHTGVGLSHRSCSLLCQEEHDDNVCLAGVGVGALPNTTQQVLSRKVTLLSTASGDGEEHVHTVFFR